MPAPYQGNAGSIRPRMVTTIDVPVDADPANAAVFQSPYEKLADLVEFLMEQAGLQDAANTFADLNIWKGPRSKAEFDCLVITNGQDGDDNPARMCVANPVARKLVDELKAANANHVRMYVGPEGLEFVHNAVWNTASQLWDYEQPSITRAVKLSYQNTSGLRLFAYNGPDHFSQADFSGRQIILQPMGDYGPGTILGATSPNVALLTDPGVAGVIAPVREPIHLVGATGEPAFQGFWRNSPAFVNGSPVGFFRDAFGVVHLQGQPVNGVGLIFTLPAGYRPATNLMIPYISDQGDSSLNYPIVFSILRIQPDGSVISQGPAASGRAASLDSISFPV